jgi:hypothetical protein
MTEEIDPLGTRIDFYGTPDDLSVLWSELERHVSDGIWSLVPENVRRYGELCPGVPVLFFDCATQIPRHARLVLFHEHNRISITNIWPRESDELSDDHRERIGTAFFQQVVTPTSVGSRITVTFG